MARFNTKDEEQLLAYISEAHHDEEEPYYMVIPDSLFGWSREKIIGVATELHAQGVIEFSGLYNSTRSFGTSSNLTMKLSPLHARILDSGRSRMKEINKADT
ncbi:hypothetical protein EHLJMEHL_02211 [Vreelandella titanicae]